MSHEFTCRYISQRKDSNNLVPMDTICHVYSFVVIHISKLYILVHTSVTDDILLCDEMVP